MRRGEDIDARRAMRAGEPWPGRRIVERILRKAPAGERRRIAMHDADAQIADARGHVRREPADTRALCRHIGGGSPQIVQDFIRARDHAVIDMVGIGAAAAGADVGRARDLGLDIAADRAMAGDAPRDLGEPIGRCVEPMKIAVEDDGRVFGFRQPLDCLERRQIAVQPADDVEHVRLDLRRAAERRRIVAIIERAHPPGGGRAVDRRADAAKPHHSAASFNAPPQLEPWPAVQPKQWPATRTASPARSSCRISERCTRFRPARVSARSSIWLKSQSNT